MTYETFKVDIKNNVAHVAINRPTKANSMNQQAWDDLKAIFEEADRNTDIRCIVISGEGKHFCAGIDLAMLMNVTGLDHIKCQARKREKFIEDLKYLQECI